DALTEALRDVLRRHPSLRTTFHRDGDQLVQTLAHEPEALQLDVRSVEAHELEAIASAEADRPFDLSRDLLLRAVLLSTAPEDHVLLVIVHHIAADGWSLVVILRELAAAYAARVRGGAPAAPP